jgi:CRP-like cAMP-binding protein
VLGYYFFGMKAITIFLKYIQSIAPLNESELTQLRDCLGEESYPAKHILLNEGQQCRDFFFLHSGVVWIYKPFKDELKTLNVFGPNSMFTDIHSIKYNLPSEYFFYALTSINLVRIRYSDIQKLYNLSPVFDRIMRVIYEETLIKAMDRTHEILYYDATQRFKNFMNTRADLINLVPQKYIASYIDITPETFSRLRRDYAKGLI